MRVRGNWISLVAWRSFSSANSAVEKSIARVSSGLSINSAADDAAGLGISERIKTQFRGVAQANRNALDGISLVNTAEGALNEIHSLLQRGRELSVQAANGTLDNKEKASIQYEIDHILAEIDRISGMTTFNNRRLLSSGDVAGASAVINGLRTGWLEQAEKLVQTQYGIAGDLSTITIDLQQNAGSGAWTTGTRNAVTGRLDGLTLHVNLTDFANQSGPVNNDRQIARALTQAIMFRNVDVNLVDPWFVSGASDYIAGGTEQLKANVDAHGAQAVVDAMHDALTGTWTDDSLHRSAAYAAVRYLDTVLPASQMKNVMQQLQQPGATLNDAFLNTFGDTVANLINNHFSVDGVTFIQSLNLNGPDVGAIGGGTATTVIPKGTGYSESPLVGFKIKWPPPTQPDDIILQIGANEGQTLKLAMTEVSGYSLDLMGIDVVNNAQDAIDRFGKAITTVSGVRSTLGVAGNRLEHTINSNQVMAENSQASYSRITDLDTALEMTVLTRQQVLLQSSGAMLAQANASRQHVLWLLKGLSFPPGSAMALA
jgi:flagellin